MTNAPNGSGPESEPESGPEAQPESGPESGPELEPGSEPQGRCSWRRLVLGAGAIAILVGAGSTWAGWIFVRGRLTPWATAALSQTLQRPVELGDVERFSPLGVRFGPSAVPATATDPDTLHVEAIEVRFNPLHLWRRRFRPQIALQNVQLYVEQDETGQWLNLDLDLPERDPDQDPFIQVNPTIRLENATVMARPHAVPDQPRPTTLVFEEVRGSLTLTQRRNIPDPRSQNQPQDIVDAQQIQFQLTAASEAAGQAQVQGDLLQFLDPPDAPETLADWVMGTLAVELQGVNLAAIAPGLLATSSPSRSLPLTVTGGQVNGAIELELTPREPLRITGSARLQAGSIDLDALEQPVEKVSAQFRFQGNRMAVENATAQYGVLTAKAGGLIDSRNGYDLKGEIEPFDLAEAVDLLPLDQPLSAAGTFRAEAALTGPLAEPALTGRLVSVDTVTLDRVAFSQIEAEIAYTHPELTLTQLNLEPLAGGRLTGTGRYTLADPRELSLQLVGTALPADAIGRSYGLPDTITLGVLALEADISGPLDDLTGVISWQAPDGTYPTRGVAEIQNSVLTLRESLVQVAGGTVAATGTLAAGAWNANLVAQGIQLGGFNDRLGDALASGTAQLSGTLDNLTLAGIRGSGDLTSAIAGGTLASQFTLANGAWNAAVQGQGLNIAQFAPNAPVGALSTNAQFSGSVTSFALDTIRGSGDLAAAVAGGNVVSQFTLANGTWTANGQGQNLQLAQFSRDLRGLGAATFQLTGNLDNLTAEGIRGQAQLTLSEGLATLARLRPQGQQQSPLTAAVAWDGRILRIDQAEGSGLVARGTIQPRFTGPGAPAIGNIDLAIQARDYALATLPLPFSRVVALDGQATFDGRLRGTPADLNLVGTVALADLAVNELAFEPLMTGDVRFSSRDGLALAVTGQQDQIVANYGIRSRQADFRIQAGDAVAVGNTEGDFLQARLYNFPLSLLGLPPAEAAQYGTLRGNVTFANATVNLRNLSTVGQFDVADVGLGYISVDRVFGGFTYGNGVITLSSGEIRMVDRASDDEILDERTYQVAGRFGLGSDPQLQGSLTTQRGTLQDLLTILKVTEVADLGRGLRPPAGLIPSSQAEADAILTTVPAGDPEASLLNRLRRISEIQELGVIEDRTARAEPLPPLEELQGLFRGTVQVTANLPVAGRAADVNLGFNLQGQDWRWGRDFRADEVLARGSFQNGQLQLNPLRLASEVDGEVAAITLVGETVLNSESPSRRPLTLTLENIPVDSLQAPLQLPFPIAGRLNGEAVLQGALTDPSLTGNVILTAGTINNRPIQAANADFTYTAARLNLSSSVELVDAEDLLTFNLATPFQPAFVRRRPVNEAVVADLEARDDGLALVNLFTDRISWQGGEGALVANLQGRWDGSAPLRELFSNLDTLEGFLRLNGATVGLQALPDAPLTNVVGSIRLAGLSSGTGSIDLRRPALVVDSLEGDFSDGYLSASGSFPLYLPLSPQGNSTEEGEASRPVEQQPLTLLLDDLAMNITGLYAGEVKGQIVVGGSLLAGAQLGGQVDLNNGRITIPEGGNGGAGGAGDSGEDGLAIPDPLFNSLMVRLGSNVQVIQGNVLNVAAQGNLRLNGLVTRPEPLGVIRLTSGRVNLFTTSLRLTGDNNRAEFRDSFDPILRVSLVASVADTTNRSVLTTSSPYPRTEVPDLDVDNLALTQRGVRTIRIQAEVDAPASQLTGISGLEDFRRVVRLSSSPARSETEIFSLLSGDVLTALGSTVTGEGSQNLEGILGAVAINFLQNLVADALPSTEFRIFSARPESNQSEDGLDIGAEVGYQVSPTIAVSILKVVTNQTPFQFNVRYRISDQFTLRGTTSFQEFRERSGLLLEYETRF